MANDDNVI